MEEDLIIVRTKLEEETKKRLEDVNAKEREKI